MSDDEREYNAKQMAKPAPRAESGPTPSPDIELSAAEFIDAYDKPLRIRDGNHKAQILDFAEAYARQRLEVVERERDEAHKRIAAYEYPEQNPEDGPYILVPERDHNAAQAELQRMREALRWVQEQIGSVPSEHVTELEDAIYTQVKAALRTQGGEK